MTDVHETARVEIERLEEDLLYTEKGHFAAASTLHKVHTQLGVLATVTAAASVAAIVAESTTWVPGILALVASISSAVLTFVKPDERAAQHLQAGRALGSLRVRMRQFRTLELPHGFPESVRESVTSLSQEKTAADAASPALSDRAFNRGKKAIEVGRFDHAVDG